mgnify:CR=1 FL=1
MSGYTFDKQSAQRISKSVQATERLDITADYYAYRGRGALMALGKYASDADTDWAKGSTATVEVYNMGTREKTEQTAEVHNLFVDIKPGSWVLFQQGYLLAAECEGE